jgi:hypothetical protein
MYDEKPHVTVRLDLFTEGREREATEKELWYIGYDEPKRLVELLIGVTRALISKHYFLTVEEMKREIYLFERFVGSIEFSEESEDD